MCGIIGYIGNQPALPYLMDGLASLEYRGYDSAGIALRSSDGTIQTVKTRGRVAQLSQKLASLPSSTAFCGIGHTRWATHGVPSDVNAHPHAAPSLVLVHNGIIENYADLAHRLRKKGYRFLSDTDTEVAAAWIDFRYQSLHDPLRAIAEATEEMRGSFAFAILFRDHPDQLYAVRRGSPLLVAQASHGGLVASDLPAILAHTNRYVRLEENVVAVLDRRHGVTFFDRQGSPVSPAEEQVEWSVEQAQKGGYPHFMMKEIHEQPEALRETVAAYLKDGLPFFGEERIDANGLADFTHIHIVACGTAMHAGLIGKSLIESLARIPVSVEIASEFRYRDPIIKKTDLVILISQSGETADTLAALRHAKEKGALTLAVVNVPGSSAAREADCVMHTHAGPEIAVASTKAYTVQCAVMCLLAIRTALATEAISEEYARMLCRELLTEIPDAIRTVLDEKEAIARIADYLLQTEHLFYIGRGLDADIAAEASLKLKEISYIHSESYAAGELKHGTISLVTEQTPVIAVTTHKHLVDKTVSGIREVKARGAFVIAVAPRAWAEAKTIPCDQMISVPSVREEFSVFPAVTALQLLAYFVSAKKGLDVDKPRNLAKSVTVE